jgi:hypothetical protein
MKYAGAASVDELSVHEYALCKELSWQEAAMNSALLLRANRDVAYLCRAHDAREMAARGRDAHAVALRGTGAFERLARLERSTQVSKFQFSGSERDRDLELTTECFDVATQGRKSQVGTTLQARKL